MDIMQLLQESVKLDEDIQDIMDSVLPPANFISESFEALTYEADNYINEAVADYELYKSQAMQVAIESASSMNESALQQMQTAINECIAERAQNVAQRVAQAFRALANKLSIMVTKFRSNEIVKQLKNMKAITFTEKQVDDINKQLGTLQYIYNTYMPIGYNQIIDLTYDGTWNPESIKFDKSKIGSPNIPVEHIPTAISNAVNNFIKFCNDKSKEYNQISKPALQTASNNTNNTDALKKLQNVVKTLNAVISMAIKEINALLKIVQSALKGTESKNDDKAKANPKPAAANA